jgi:hypothetical protein
MVGTHGINLYCSVVEPFSCFPVNRPDKAITKNETSKKFYLYPNDFMPFHRNFTYWIDKRRWKYCFLLSALAMDSQV